MAKAYEEIAVLKRTAVLTDEAIREFEDMKVSLKASVTTIVEYEFDV